MKQLLIIVLIIVPFIGSSQKKDSLNKRNIVYLKDGGHLIGTTYAKDDQNTQWQLVSGEIIQLPNHLIGKIQTINHRTEIFSNGKKAVQSGYYGSFTLNPIYFSYKKKELPNMLNSVLLSFSSGYRFTPYIATGIGISIAQPKEDLLIPLFLEFRGDILKKATTPIYNLQLGYSLPASSNTSWSPSKGGPFLEPSLGVKFHTKNKLSWLLRCGYLIQKEKIDFIWDINPEEWTYRRLNLQLGIEF